jgi:hypothetical protein
MACFAPMPNDLLSILVLNVNHRRLQATASDSSYAATGQLNEPTPIPGAEPKAL